MQKLSMFVGGLVSLSPPALPPSSLPFLCLFTCQGMFMQCQAATLNTFKLILMDAQSQGLSLHPLDVQYCLGNIAICNFISVSFPPSIQAAFLHPLSFHQFTLFFLLLLCFFDSFHLPFSRFLHLFLLGCFWMLSSNPLSGF